MTTPYRIIIGLEVHVQLRTESKLFCRCSTVFGADPNTQVCPVCLGLPGALPVLNRRAVELSIQTGLALHCQIAEFTKWDRKNYFYPDLPKGYQISQYDLPICAEGFLDIEVDDAPEQTKRVRIIRAHLEEDAGKSMHDEAHGRASSRIDLNRTGTPLLEIVSYPDIASAEEAKKYLTELKLLLTYLGVSDCNMQEGSLRADANVNLAVTKPDGVEVVTPIVEIKNLNSFRAVERAIDFEVNRQYQQWQRDGLEKGQAPKQTRGWDDDLGVTVLQREKEESADYRYFPDPDLAPVCIARDEVAKVQLALGELPQAMRRRFQSEHQLKFYDADVIVSQGRGVSTYFEDCIRAGATAKRASAWLQQDILRTMRERNVAIEQFPIAAPKLAELLIAIESGKLDTTRGRLVFQHWLDNAGLSLAETEKVLGFEQVDDSELESICRELLIASPDVVKKVRDGNPKALGSLVGQAKKRNANADPRTVQDICMRLIQSGFDA
jgi:aspartyl-tRNA(Asn)/glutamyl-tRNA(Gln) amidotransferase subunit B